MRKNIALLALENEEVEEVVVPAAVPAEEVETRVEEARAETVVDDIVEAPEAEIAEMTEIAVEMEEAEAAVDEGVETAETLGEMREQLEAAVDEGGVEPIAAEAIRIAVEHLRARVGMAKGQSGIAIEGFKSKTTRIQSTQIAIEAISDTVAKIWQAIVNAFGSAIEWIRKFFAGLFDAAKKVAGRAEKVAAAAKAKKGQVVPEGKKLEAGKLLKVLRLKNEVVAGEAFVKAYKAQQGELYQNLSELVGEAAVESLGQAAEAVLADVADEAKFEAALKKLVAALPNPVASDAKTELPKGMELKEANPLLGDRALFVAGFAEDVELADVKANLSKVKVYIGEATGTQELKDTEVAVLTAEEAEVIAVQTKGHMDSYAQLKAAVDKLGQLQKKLQGKAKDVIKAAGKDANAAKNAQIAAAAARLVISMTTTVVAQFRNYDLSLANAALNYAALSLKTLEGGKVKEGKEVVPA